MASITLDMIYLLREKWLFMVRKNYSMESKSNMGWQRTQAEACGYSKGSGFDALM